MTKGKLWGGVTAALVAALGYVLIVVWNYGEYGRFEMKWEEPNV